MTIDDFQRMVVASALVDEDDVAALRAELSDPSPEALGELLVSRQLINAWQCGQLLEGRYKGFFIEGKFKLLEFVGCIGNRSRYLSEDIYTRKQVILSFESPRERALKGLRTVYDVEKIQCPKQWRWFSETR
jgi:hypothetical protein